MFIKSFLFCVMCITLFHAAQTRVVKKEKFIVIATESGNVEISTVSSNQNVVPSAFVIDDDDEEEKHNDEQTVKVTSEETETINDDDDEEEDTHGDNDANMNKHSNEEQLSTNTSSGQTIGGIDHIDDGDENEERCDRSDESSDENEEKSDKIRGNYPEDSNN